MAPGSRAPTLTGRLACRSLPVLQPDSRFAFWAVPAARRGGERAAGCGVRVGVRVWAATLPHSWRIHYIIRSGTRARPDLPSSCWPKSNQVTHFEVRRPDEMMMMMGVIIAWPVHQGSTGAGSLRRLEASKGAPESARRRGNRERGRPLRACAGAGGGSPQWPSSTMREGGLFRGRPPPTPESRRCFGSGPRRRGPRRRCTASRTRPRPPSQTPRAVRPNRSTAC